jgi:hypothetical protein
MPTIIEFSGRGLSAQMRKKLEAYLETREFFLVRKDRKLRRE